MNVPGLTKDTAIVLMSQGLKLTHTYFSKDEWVTMIPGMNMMLTEDGYKTVSGEWWSYRMGPAFETGWSLWEETITIEIDNKVYQKIQRTISKNLDTIDTIYHKYVGHSFIDRTLFSPNMMEEYKLIVAKKSKLSSSKRRHIVSLFNKNFKLIKNLKK